MTCEPLQFAVRAEDISENRYVKIISSTFSVSELLAATGLDVVSAMSYPQVANKISAPSACEALIYQYLNSEAPSPILLDAVKKIYYCGSSSRYSADIKQVLVKSMFAAAFVMGASSVPIRGKLFRPASIAVFAFWSRLCDMDLDLAVQTVEFYKKNKQKINPGVSSAFIAAVSKQVVDLHNSPIEGEKRDFYKLLFVFCRSETDESIKKIKRSGLINQFYQARSTREVHIKLDVTPAQFADKKLLRSIGNIQVMQNMLYLLATQSSAITQIVLSARLFSADKLLEDKLFAKHMMFAFKLDNPPYDKILAENTSTNVRLAMKIYKRLKSRNQLQEAGYYLACHSSVVEKIVRTKNIDLLAGCFLALMEHCSNTKSEKYKTAQQIVQKYFNCNIIEKILTKIDRKDVQTLCNLMEKSLYSLSRLQGISFSAKFINSPIKNMDKLAARSWAQMAAAGKPPGGYHLLPALIKSKKSAVRLELIRNFQMPNSLRSKSTHQYLVHYFEDVLPVMIKDKSSSVKRAATALLLNKIPDNNLIHEIIDSQMISVNLNR